MLEYWDSKSYESILKMRINGTRTRHWYPLSHLLWTKIVHGGTTVNCQGVWGGGIPPPPAASGKKETMVVKQGLKGTEKQTEDGFSL